MMVLKALLISFWKIRRGKNSLKQIYRVIKIVSKTDNQHKFKAQIFSSRMMRKTKLPKTSKSWSKRQQ